jgi:hypothetical protein
VPATPMETRSAATRTRSEVFTATGTSGYRRVGRRL